MRPVFEIADRVHIMWLGRRVATIAPKSHTMAEAVAYMTGATSFKSET
jgi:fructose transport system ATP-binding protein